MPADDRRVPSGREGDQAAEEHRAGAPGVLASAAHRAWLEGEFQRLVAFPRDPRHPAGGFGYLDVAGTVSPNEPIHTWITARMTHVYALASLRGVPHSDELVEHGIAALLGPLHDPDHGGWYASIGPDGAQNTTKDAYQHAFVVLAAASATAAGAPRAEELLDLATRTFEQRFWDRGSGRFVESFDQRFRISEPYRGANSNMHAVEACLAVGDVTRDERWYQRALSVATRLIGREASDPGWRLVEHFDPDWTPLPDYNREYPDHPFRPYGTTVGHWLEWSRLLLQLEAALPRPPAWLLTSASALFERAVTLGWARDGRAGFVYTLDFDDRPVVAGRFHWVAAEAIGAAATLFQRTGDAGYELWYQRFWAHVQADFIDLVDGSWHHELDAELQPRAGTWSGKPDLYHAVQATLLPRCPIAPSLVATQQYVHRGISEAEPVDDPHRT